MVSARETTLQELLEGSKQFQVPLYQRTYSWSRKQFERLFDDLEALAEDRDANAAATHFIGSLVLAPTPALGPAGVAEYLVVDGQQRLTTLSLLLCAIRDHRARTEGTEHRDRLNHLYLQNPWKQGRQRLKLVPTQADRDAYLACLDGTAQAGGADPIGAAYRYFSGRLVAADDPDDPLDIERIELAALHGLTLVAVTVQQGDNAHRIFESLNNTGLKLTQGDLLRNYLFMRLPTRGEEVYEGLWLPLQSLLGDDLEQLFWLDLVHRDPRIKQTDIYSTHQARIDQLPDEAAVVEEIKRFSRLGELYKRVLDPTREGDPEVRLRLDRMRDWGTTTANPLLLHLLQLRADGAASSAQIARAMLYVESFLVRRVLIGRATAGINRILVSTVTEMNPALAPDAAVHRYLSAGRKHYASDAEISAAVTSVPFYLNGRPAQRSLILRWLEESYGWKEPVDPADLTVEHVLPQTMSPHWRTALQAELGEGEDPTTVHLSLIHTLGNLTLTGYNSSLSNNPFGEKRELLRKSGLQMNQEIAAHETWGRAQILARAQGLAKRIEDLWPAPLAGVHEDDTSEVWTHLDRALMELPAGAWTTYGDLAALIGSHPVPVGMRLAKHPVPNAHRVLQSAGTVSPNFRWLELDRTDDPLDVLRGEGVTIDEAGRAAAHQRFTVEELAELTGLTAAGELAVPPAESGSLGERRESFLAQLEAGRSAGTVHGVLAVLAAWTELGGTLDFGTSAETSCFLMARTAADPRGEIWPVVLYPSGKVEIVFQYLASREPFSELALRDEFRTRLNEIPGVDLPASKLALRPGFETSVLADGGSRARFVEQLGWFLERAQQPLA